MSRGGIFPRGVWRAGVLAGTAALGLCIFGARVGRADQPQGDVVGRIEGDAIAVTGPMTVGVVAGQTQTVLRSGADVRVKSGSARIDLVEGGQIAICGPAHFSVLKSGAALTIALDSGTVHAFLQGQPAITFYTPQIKAQPISIGDGAEETLVGIDAAGSLCIRASHGAVRLEQQLTGQSLIVPQSGDVLISNGQLENPRNNAGRCTCELQPAKLISPQAPIPNEVSRPATADEIGKGPAPESKPPANAGDEVVYKVYVPPLVYDATKKAQPEIDPKLIVLVRRVRVRPTLIFQGRVDGDAVASNTPPALEPTAGSRPASSTAPVNKSAPGSGSFVDRVKTFMRRLWSRVS